MAAPLTMQQLGWFEWEVYRLQRTSSALPASVKVVSGTSAYTVSDDDWYVFVDASVGGTDVTLPIPQPRAGHEYVIKKTDSDAPAVRIQVSDSSATLDGDYAYRLRVQNECVTFVSDGTQWRVVNHIKPEYPEGRIVLYDDFMSLNGNTAGTDVVSSHSWRTAGATPGVEAAHGRVRVDGNGATQGRFELTRAGTFNLVTAYAYSFDFRTRVAQLGSSAGTRQFGLGTAALTGSVDGIYFRHTNGGNYTCVVRSSGSEDTTDSGVAAAADTFHTFRIVTDIISATVSFHIDGTRVALFSQLTHDVPLAALGISYAAGGTAANTGLTLDYVYLEQTRATA